jgi:hypothetical protein
MREYGRVHSAFWSSADVSALSDDGKLLALYLLTCTHGTIAGAFCLPYGYVGEDMGWSPDRVAKGFEELFANGFSNRCETTKWVWVRKFLRWNAPENPNQWKAVFKVVRQIPERCAWRLEFERDLAALSNLDPTQEGNGYQRVTEPSRNHNSTQPISTENTTQLEPSIQTSTASASEPEVPRETSKANEQAVFDHWKREWGHPNAFLDAKRRMRIRARLKDFTVEQLCNAISGFRNSPWHCGTDPKGNGKVYDAVDTLLRDTAQVETGIRLLQNPPRAPPRQETASERILRTLNGDNSRVIEHEPERLPAISR